MPESTRDGSGSVPELRTRAEQRLRETTVAEGFSPEEAQAVLHELRVHQIELEMQNDSLRTTQAELELARERFEELYDFAPVGYLTVDAGGEILMANLTCVELLGVERSRLLGAPFGRFVIPADRDEFHLCLRRVLGSALVQTCEMRLQPYGRDDFYARIAIIRAEDQGRPICRLTLSDITEQKRAQEAERERAVLEARAENEQRLRLAFEAGELGTWDHDLQTGKIVCSERTRAMLALEVGHPVTWPEFLAQVHADDHQSLISEAEISTHPESSGCFDLTFRLAQPGRAVRWLRLVARTLFDPAPPGKPLRRIGVLADITRQKEAEALLASRAWELESLVRERTARLQDALAELEHFSYTLVHDLRAPLRAIRGFGDLVLRQAANLDPNHRQFLQRSNLAAERMDQLIVDALNYNRLVHQNFEMAPVDGLVLLEQMLLSYPNFLEARPHISLEGPMPPVVGNPALLTQCFSNLLSNALKFIPPGQTPRVRIFAEDRGARVRFVVEDNGVGVAAECQERIFEMFQRAHQGFEGTGIGLALVRKSAQRMNGSVGVQSQPGQGSRFWVELDKAGAEPRPEKERRDQFEI